MRKLQVGIVLMGLAMLLASGCSSDSGTAASSDSAPYGLSTASSTLDGNQDGVNEQMVNSHFSYDAQGRVIGYETTYQTDNDSDGLVDSGMRFSVKFDPTIPADTSGGSYYFFLRSAAHAMASPAALTSSRAYFGPDLFAQLILEAPVEMVIEDYGTGVGPVALGLADNLVLQSRLTQTFGFDAQGRLNKIALRMEDSGGTDQMTLSASFDAAGNLLEDSELDQSFDPGSATPSSATLYRSTYSYDDHGNLIKQVDITDDNNDGFYEGQTIANYANDYNAAGQLIQMVETDPASTEIQTTSYSYDEAGNLVGEDYQRQDAAGAPVLEHTRTDYTYDAAGNTLTESHARDNYDAINGVSQADGTWDYKYDYSWTYDSANRQLSQIYRYDNSVDGIWDGGHERYWSYDEAGRLTEYQDLDGVAPNVTPQWDYTYQYDSAGRVVQKVYTNSSGTETNTFSFDANGRFLGTVDSYVPVLGTGWTYSTTLSYDDQGQLSGYLTENDDNGDSTIDSKDEATVTINGAAVQVDVKSYNFDAGTSSFVLNSEQTFDLSFLSALPSGDMELPVLDNDVNLTLPKLPGLLMYYQQMGAD